MRPTRVAVAGSVDDGKSTLLGRLMCDSERVFDDEVEAVRLANRGERPNTLNLAFFTDGLITERAEGLTLDVAWRHLTLGTRRLLLADVPGHAELVRNMATGASIADAALLLVDAERGLRPQTRRHLVMLGGLGVKEVVVCINKMDAVAFEPSVATMLGEALRSLAAQLGVSLEVIPVSALEGDNIVTRGHRMPWYAGPTVAQRLEAMEPRAPPTRLRAVVQLESEESGWTSLHVLAGQLTPGDVLSSWPERGSCRVLECSPHGVGRVRLEPALPRGTLLTAKTEPPRVGTEAELIVTWLGPGECAPGLELTVLQHGRRMLGKVKPQGMLRVSRESGALELTSRLATGDVGHVRLELERATWFDSWDESPPTASCLLIDSTGRTVAGARFT